MFLDASNINFCMEKIENNIRNIYDNIDYLTKLDEVLNFFYEANYKNYIISINNLKNEIINGMLKTINMKKDSIDQLKKIIPEFEKIYQLKSSGIFLKLFHNNKFNKLIRNHKGNLLNESKENFNQFKYIFKEDWIKSLNKKYLNIIKEIDDDEIENELNIMKKIFNLYDINDSKISELKNEIILFKNNNFYEILSNSFTISSSENQYNEHTDINILIKELKNEKAKNKKLEKEINRLTNELSKEESKIKDLNDKIKISEKTYFKEINEYCIKLNELKEKLSKFPFELNDNEKMISIIFVSFDESIIDAIICKNTDKFSKIEKQLYQIYPEYEGKINFMNNGIYINKENNLEENKIYNNSKINIINIEPI